MIVMNLLILIGLLLILLLFLVYCCVFTYPKRKRPSAHNIPKGPIYDGHKENMLRVINDMETTPHETIEQISHDGLTLSARLYHNADGTQPIVLFCHGYHGLPEWDGYGMYQICKKQGYSILMPDMRGHGKSGGSITFGIREHMDVKLWINYILERFGSDTKILLAGVSMGATSVIMAAEDSKVAKSTIGIISDCAFAHPSGVLKPVFDQFKIPCKLIFFLIHRSAKLFGRFDLKESSAIETVPNLQPPILFLHGTKDFIVPVSMCEELYCACSSSKKIRIFENANHANCALTDYEEYEKTVLQFLSEFHLFS